MGLYEAARELGLRVPQDLSVVGFDDLPMARWTSPPLTTVRQPLVEMAEAAARLVIAIGRGNRPASLRTDLATRLVERGSTVAPAGAAAATAAVVAAGVVGAVGVVETADDVVPEEAGASDVVVG